MFLRRVSSKTSQVSFSKNFWTKTFSTNQSSAEAEKTSAIEKELKAFSEYSQGLHYESQGKHSLAHDQYKRILDILEQSHLTGSEPHVYILKKLAKSQIALQDNINAEKYFKSLLDSVGKFSNDATRKYEVSNNLLKLYLRSDIEKSIPFAKNLLNEGKSQNLPSALQAQTLFNLGTAQLLNGNFEESLNTFRETLTLQQEGVGKGFTLNNLALADWWNSSTPTVPEEIDQFLLRVTGTFKESIYNIEANEGPSELKELLQKDTLVPADKTKFDPDTQVFLQRKESGLPLLNIARFLSTVAPSKKNEMTFWIKYAMKSYEKNDQENIGKVLMVLAQFYGESKQYIRAEGLFRSALEFLEKKDDFHKVLCLQSYGKMLTNITNRKAEGENVISDANKQAEAYPKTAERMTYVYLPNIEL